MHADFPLAVAQRRHCSHILLFPFQHSADDNGNQQQNDNDQNRNQNKGFCSNGLSRIGRLLNTAVGVGCGVDIGAVIVVDGIPKIIGEGFLLIFHRIVGSFLPRVFLPQLVVCLRCHLYHGEVFLVHPRIALALFGIEVIRTNGKSADAEILAVDTVDVADFQFIGIGEITVQQDVVICLDILALQQAVLVDLFHGMKEPERGRYPSDC